MSKYVRPKLKSWCVTPPAMEVGRQAPARSVAYRVQDGDSWQSLATQWGVDVWSLINFNFRTYDPKVVNWYLQEYVGCVKPTADKRNWCFSSAAVPGIIYRPLEKPAPLPGPVPVPMPTPGPGPIDQPWKPGTGAWIGIGVKAGGQVALGGADSATIVAISMDDPRDFVLMQITMGRMGLGLGASGGMVLCGIGNCYDPRALRGYPVSGGDFQLAVGPKWGSLVKVARLVPELMEALDAGRDVVRLLKSGVISAARRHQIVNHLKSAEGCRTLFPDSESTEVSINVVDLPLGAGTEASVYYGWGHVEVLAIHEVS